MRITFVLPFAGLAGGNRVVAIYAEHLQRRGHQVTVVSQPRQQPTLEQSVKGLLRGRLPRRRSSATPYFDPLPIEHRILERPRPVTDADLPDADVVIATWWETAFAVARLSPAKGLKVYFVQHHEVHQPATAHFAAGSYHLPLRKIAIAGWLVDTMAELYGDRDVDLVPNSVDLDQFNAPPRGRRPRPTVGFLYSTAGFKGLRGTLGAIETVRRSHPDLETVSFGAIEPVRELPLPPACTFTRQPPQGSIREIYAACDVWVVGSKSEGFGLPILEAMACRTPVVATRLTAAPDLIEDGVSGYLVDPDDPAALAEKIAAALALDDAAWRAMSEKARARAEAYTWDDATGLLEAALLRQIETFR